MGKIRKKRSTPPPTEHLKKFQFKPGQSGNPSGMRPNPIAKALKELTVETYREVVSLVCTGNLAELQRMIEDPKTSALQVGVATAFLRAMRDGDYETIERIAQRIVGKIPDELKVTSQNLNLNANAAVTSLDDAKVKAAIAIVEGDV